MIASAQPRPDIAGFWDRIARKYAADPIGDIPAYERTLDRARAWLPLDGHALELGCGTGTTALKLAPSVERYTATDVSPGMIEIALERKAEAGDRIVDFLVAEASDPILETGAWDAVLAFSLLHLVPEPAAALRRIHDLLRPGGVFITKTPCLGRVSPYWPFVKVMQAVGKAPPVHFLGVRQFHTMIAEAGFQIVETGSYPKRMNAFVVARKAS